MVFIWLFKSRCCRVISLAWQWTAPRWHERDSRLPRQPQEEAEALVEMVLPFVFPHDPRAAIGFTCWSTGPAG